MEESPYKTLIEALLGNDQFLWAALTITFGPPVYKLVHGIIHHVSMFIVLQTRHMENTARIEADLQRARARAIKHRLELEDTHHVRDDSDETPCN